MDGREATGLAPSPAPTCVPTRPERPPLFPSLDQLIDWRQPFLIPLALLVITRVAFWRLLPFASEDAYITFRYARNLVLGDGLTFNPGERVLGFSSPLWTLWNALGWAVCHDPVAWSRTWSVLGDVVALLVVGRLLERHASRASAWCFNLFFALWTYFAAVAVSGMENSMMFTLIVLSAALVERKSRATWIVLTALAFIRPEGPIAAGVIGLGAQRRDRLLALAVIAAGMVALWSYFGAIVPQSVMAKSAIYGTPGPLGGRHWWEWLVPFPLGRWPATSEGSILFAMVVVTGAAAAAGLVGLWRARRTGLGLAVGAALTVWIAYSLLGVAYFFWYLAVPLAGTMMLAAIGLPRITRGPVLYVASLAFVVGTWTVAPRLYMGRAYAEAASFGAVADYLASQASANQKVLLEPIGMVGYRCRVQVIDEVGLVSPQVTRRRLEGAGWLTDVVRDERPDWLILRRGVLEDGRAFAGAGDPFRNVAERDSLTARYHVATLIHEEAGDQALAVLARSR